MKVAELLKDKTAEEAVNDQLLTTVEQINHWISYPSDDGLDYLSASLDLSQMLIDCYISDNNYDQALLDLSEPKPDLDPFEEDEAHNIDQYACDGISHKLNDFIHHLAKAVKEE